jgi:Cu/Ag efflux pump CusA
MTLGGLALAVGILVDESTVEVENIHHQMEGTSSVARAVRRGNQQTAIPRLLAMLCVLAVFIPSFFMQGAAQALFVPLSLAVGFAMVTSYLLSSTFVPVLSTWLLQHHHRPTAGHRRSLFEWGRDAYGRAIGGVVRLRWLVVPAYIAVSLGVIVMTMTQPKAIGEKSAVKREIPTPRIGTFARAASVANLIVGTLVFVEFSVISVVNRDGRGFQMGLWLVPFVTAVIWGTASVMCVVGLTPTWISMLGRWLIGGAARSSPSARSGVWDHWLDGQPRGQGDP